MNVFLFCGIIAAALSLSMILKKLGGESYRPVAVVIGLALLKTCLGLLLEKAGFINEMLNESGAGGYRSVLIKAAGITLLVETVSGICRDLNENELADKAVILGKAELIAISLPLLKRLFDLTKTLSVN